MPVPSVQRLLSATYIARLCGVDPKTIHNWCDRGRIQHFKTPGRHLRFRPADVVSFLREQGYGVPKDLLVDLPGALVIGTEITCGAVKHRLAPEVMLRHAAHAFDGLVLAGVGAADVYVVEMAVVEAAVRSMVPDAGRLVQALHRSAPSARMVLLGRPMALPPALPVTWVADRDSLGLDAALAFWGPKTTETSAPRAAER